MSNISFGPGSLYMNDVLFSGVKDGECAAEGFVNIKPAILNSNAEATFEGSLTMNSDMLPYLYTNPHYDKFYVTTEVPIMIQARWHKNVRIRKKWLKRYGMRADTVTLVHDTHNLSYDPVDGCFEFDAYNPRFELRPHQMRRDIKIEFI